MKDRIHRLREAIGHIGAKSLAAAILVIIATTVIASLIGNANYATEKKVLQQQGELNAKESAIEYDRCLLTRVNIVTVVGYAVDTMIASGKDNSEIVKFITDETNYIIATLDPSTTGIYGWINEEYLDGAGWVPDEDYVATERPWYIQTLKSNQEITFVEPYLDMQTNTVMMTVSDLMNDGKSVVAMDVSLDRLQQIVEKVASATAGSQAFILDTSGIVVAHSNLDELGKNYLEEADSLGGAIARKILDEKQMQFDLKMDEGNYSVYVDQLQGGWYSVSLIDSDVWYRPLQRTTLLFSVILVVIVVFLCFVFLRLNAKNQALQRLHNRVYQEEKRGNEFQMLSETDRMTGLYDRVCGEHKVEDLLALGTGGMFLVLDIDHFKSFNDTYGHQYGDQVILAVADALRSTFRANDITMRLGGDEFGVFAVGIADRAMGEAIIRRLFDHLDAIEIAELRKEKFSISVGAVLCTGQEDLTFDKLYASADSAMYASKKTSGNSFAFSG